MERKKEQKLGSLLDQFVRANNLQKGLAEYRIKKAWSELLGKNVSMATKSLFLKDDKLFITLHSSVLRNELSMMKEDLIRRLNEAAGADVLKDIILR